MIHRARKRKRTEKVESVHGVNCLKKGISLVHWNRTLVCRVWPETFKMLQSLLEYFIALEARYHLSCLVKLCNHHMIMHERISVSLMKKEKWKQELLLLIRKFSRKGLGFLYESAALVFLKKILFQRSKSLTFSCRLKLKMRKECSTTHLDIASSIFQPSV